VIRLGFGIFAKERRIILKARTRGRSIPVKEAMPASLNLRSAVEFKLSLIMKSSKRAACYSVLFIEGSVLINRQFQFRDRYTT